MTTYIKQTVCCLLILLQASICFANWCDGKQYKLFEMKMSDRVQAGSEEITQETEQLNKISNELRYDIKQNLDSLTEKLQINNQDLAAQTVELCTLAKKNDYAPMDFKGIHLNDEAEIKAQVRMNLASIQTNQVVMKFLAEKKQEYLELNKQLIAKANELAILKKHFNLLQDPRRFEGQANLAISIQNACVSIDNCKTLRMTYRPMTQDELFSIASEQNKTQTVTDNQLTAFIKKCDLSSIIDHGAINTKPWWKIWE